MKDLPDVTYVVLDDRDYYGPHFDSIFFSKQLLVDHLRYKYKHPYQYEVHMYTNREGTAVKYGEAEVVDVT